MIEALMRAWTALWEWLVPIEYPEWHRVYERHCNANLKMWRKQYEEKMHDRHC